VPRTVTKAARPRERLEEHAAARRSSAEQAVTARACKAIGLPYRRAADDLDIEVEVRDQAAHDGQLLEVLLSEYARNVQKATATW